MKAAHSKLAEPFAMEPMLAEIRERRAELHKLGHIPQDLVAQFQ